MSAKVEIVKTAKDKLPPVIASFTSGAPSQTLLQNDDDGFIFVCHAKNDKPNEKTLFGLTDHIQLKGYNVASGKTELEKSNIAFNNFNYAVGVYDKETNKLKLVPVNDVFLLQQTTKGETKELEAVSFLSDKEKRQKERAKTLGVISSNTVKRTIGVKRNNSAMIASKNSLLPYHDESTANTNEVYPIRKIVNDVELESFFNGKEMQEIAASGAKNLKKYTLSAVVEDKLRKIIEAENEGTKTDIKTFHLLQFLDDLVWLESLAAQNSHINMEGRGDTLCAPIPPNSRAVTEQDFSKKFTELNITPNNIKVDVRRGYVYLAFGNKCEEALHKHFSKGPIVVKGQEFHFETSSVSLKNPLISSPKCPDDPALYYLLNNFYYEPTLKHYHYLKEHHQRLKYVIMVVALTLNNFTLPFKHIAADLKLSVKEFYSLCRDLQLTSTTTENNVPEATLVAPLSIKKRAPKKKKILQDDDEESSKTAPKTPEKSSKTAETPSKKAEASSSKESETPAKKSKKSEDKEEKSKKQDKESKKAEKKAEKKKAKEDKKEKKKAKKSSKSDDEDEMEE